MAQDHYEQALQIDRQQLGQDNPRILSIMSHLVIVLTKQEKYREAEDLAVTTLNSLVLCARVFEINVRRASESSMARIILVIQRASLDDLDSLAEATIRMTGSYTPDASWFVF